MGLNLRRIDIQENEDGEWDIFFTGDVMLKGDNPADQLGLGIEELTDLLYALVHEL